MSTLKRSHWRLAVRDIRRRGFDSRAVSDLYDDETNRAHPDASKVVGGRLLTAGEAVALAECDLEILLNNPVRSFHPVIIGRRYFFFELDCEKLRSFLASANPETEPRRTAEQAA